LENKAEKVVVGIVAGETLRNTLILDDRTNEENSSQNSV